MKTTYQVDDIRRTYQLYIPENYDPEKKIPAVVLLHEAGKSGVSLVERWRSIADKAGLILIGPSSPDKRWLINMDEADIIEAMLDDVKKNVSVDESRIFLFGHSAGGHFASYMPFFKPNLFSAIAVHAGYMNPESTTGMDAPGRKTPIAFLTGNKDTVIPIKNVADAAYFYSMSGHDTLFVEYLDHNHWYYTASDEINERALRFMGNYKLPE